MRGRRRRGHNSYNNQRYNQRSRQTDLSKALSWLLRHGAEKEKYIHMDKAGWVDCEEILDWGKFYKYRVTLQQLKDLVDADQKSRYQLEYYKGYPRIRASQGHTLKKVEDKLLLEQIKDPKSVIAVHGTFSDVWHLIYKTGLNKMARNHMHFCCNWPGKGKVISGMRNSCNVMIEVDIEKSMKDGIKWYRSQNNVILSSGINGAIERVNFHYFHYLNNYIQKYFKKVLQNNKCIMKNGKLLENVPEPKSQAQSQQLKQKKMPPGAPQKKMPPGAPQKKMPPGAPQKKMQPSAPQKQMPPSPIAPQNKNYQQKQQQQQQQKQHQIQSSNKQYKYPQKNQQKIELDANDFFDFCEPQQQQQNKTKKSQKQYKPVNNFKKKKKRNFSDGWG